MSVIRPWCRVVCILLAFSTCTEAQEAPDYRAAAATECPQDMVDSHVREQFAIYGPRSRDREYFGFIFLFEGVINSAVIEGPRCPNSNSCGINTAKAAPLIPKGARVLGEWHTHPQSGNAGILSLEDVGGARGNRLIHCYAAYYSKPDGDIYAWNPLQTSVHTAMASCVLIGSYRHESSPDSTAIVAALDD
jgi:hypothetical protein